LKKKKSNLALGVNQFVKKSQRIKTGSDGKIVLQEVFFLSLLFIYLFIYFCWLIKIQNKTSN